MFIVTRHRENLHAGASVEDSIASSIDTSGRAVLFAGITVIISVMGLYLMGLSFVQGVALASSFGVAMMMAGSLTLLPALLGLVGNRIDNTTWAALTAAGIAVVGRFIGVTTGQDLVYLAGFALAIVFFALSFAVKPLRRLVPHRVERPKEQRFWYRWSRFIQHRPWPSALGAVLWVIPASGVGAKVGGFTAASTDFAGHMAGRMPLLIGVVLLLSFVLLMAVFRSVLVPLKAVVTNLLSIGAAYGLIVAIFQWGWACAS